MTPAADRLERHALLMLAASMAGHLGNAFFHMLTGRVLPIGEYGLLIAVLGALQLFQLPLTALNLTLARQSAADPALVVAILRRGLRHSLLLTLCAFLWLGWARPAVQAFFATQWDGLSPALSLLIGFSFALTLTGGLLQGRQRFRWMAARALSLFLLRALFAAGLIFGLRASAGAALLAHLLAMAATLGVSLAGLRADWARLPAPAAPLPSAGGALGAHVLKTLPALAGFAILMSADVVMARRLFSPETSGRFAQAAVLARMVLWLPLPVASAMFPKVVTPGPEARRTLRKATLYTLALLLGTLAGFWLLCPVLLRGLYGHADAQLASWTRAMALAVAPLGLTHVRLQFELAQGRFVFGFALLALGLVYGLRVMGFPPDVPGLILSLAAASLLSAGGMLLQRRCL